TSSDASLGGYGYYFKPTKGHSYSLSGWIRAENLPSGAVAQIRLDYIGSTTPVTARDATALAAPIDDYLSWGNRNGVPMYLGEFGVYRACFEGDKGGLNWVSDMLDLLRERSLPFTYHAYHEDAFGIYYGDGTLPDPENANRPLIDLFTAKLGS
ncbi:MAG TPA: hypothetical protein VFQ35_00880, partial [Polyangiaceae bacterium]|nr:hypothetical protein [Polyangiaceae bacterium]